MNDGPFVKDEQLKEISIKLHKNGRPELNDIKGYDKILKFFEEECIFWEFGKGKPGLLAQYYTHFSSCVQKIKELKGKGITEQNFEPAWNKMVPHLQLDRFGSHQPIYYSTDPIANFLKELVHAGPIDHFNGAMIYFSSKPITSFPGKGNFCFLQPKNDPLFQPKFAPPLG